MWPVVFTLLWIPSLPPPAFGDAIVVTAARGEQRLGDAVSLVTALPGEELRRSPSLTLDEQLRARVPGFSLFRRSGSVAAHPTTQGVSLRGIGPSGTSRSLVLLDGMPLNDPFGGWVYWNRVPASALGAVEVARGAGSALYGSSALGGTVQLLPRPSADATVEVTARAGERDLADAEIFASDVLGPWSFSLAGRSFDTGGFFLLAPEDRGPVDRPARVGFDSFYGRLRHGGFHAGAQLYREERGNGTALEGSSTRIRTAEGGFGGERWSWSLYGQRQRFENAFSRVLPGRREEVPTAVQDVPATALGGSLTWRPEGGSGRGLLVGGDWRRVEWEDAAVERRQDLAGVFAQKTFRPAERLELLAGARVDRWENRATRTSLSPRLGAVYLASATWTLRASAYRGFRAPTLNELYRPFRVGNIVTAANPDLGAEHLTGVEAGADLRPRGGRASHLRINAFYNRLDDPVGNVTLEVTAQEIRRRRENLGRVTVAGLELEAGLRLSSGWRLEAGWLLSDAEVGSTGRRPPQVPRHQGTLRLSGGHGPVRVLVEGRWAGDQFEDDLEELSLEAMQVVDVALSGAVTKRLELFAAVENLLDERVVVGRLPLERLGAPRGVHAGLRLKTLW